MNKTLVFRDEEICIFKPTNFNESRIIGEPICCFAYSQERWNEHYEFDQEAIYYVYDVMRYGTDEDFVAITVRPNGSALVLDKKHNWWSRHDSTRFIQGLGGGAAVITTKEGKAIKSENKEYNIYKHMNKRTIRLTESDLHRIVKESVNRIINEKARTNESSVHRAVKESTKTSLRDFMRVWYNNDDSCIDALEKLTDEAWLRPMGWKQVFHEGIGDGVYSPEEGIVAVFDEDDLPEYHSYQLYKYNPKVWKSCDGDGWDRIYDGDNGDGYDVEPLSH